MIRRIVVTSVLFAMCTSSYSQSTKLKVTEVQTKSNSIYLCASLIAPELSKREQAAWAVLASSIENGNQIYTGYDLLKYGSQADSIPKIEWNDQVLTIQLSVPEDGLNLGLKMIDSMLRKPLLDRESVINRIKELSQPQDSDQFAMLLGQIGEIEKVDSAALNLSFQRIFDPKYLSISVSSSAMIGGRSKEVIDFFADWKSKSSPADSRGPSQKLFSGPGTCSIDLWKAPSIAMKMTDAPTFLAMISLGCGFGSIAFKEMRENRGWTYQQEIFLRPERTGWRPMFLMVGDPLNPSEVKSVLSASISKLDEFELKRAKGLANGILTRGNRLSPIFVSPYSQYLATESDRVAFAAFAGHFGGVARTELLVNSIQDVDLETLKSAAQKLVANFEPE